MILGIEIGGTKLQLVTADTSGQIVQRFRFAVDPAQGAEGILAPIMATLQQVESPLSAIGVGFGGPVNWETGQIATSHQIGGWSGFKLAEWLREQVPDAFVRVENDANVAALGEACRGVATPFQRVCYVTLGSGVGGGLVLNRTIYHGASPGELEIGHLWLVPPSLDAAGNTSAGQTFEQTVSGWAVDKQIRDLVPQLPASSPLRQSVLDAHERGEVGKEAQFLHAAYEAGDSVARMLIEQIGSVIALGLSHVVHLLHPDVLVLGGGLSLIGEPLRAAVRQALPRFIMKAFHPAPPVLLAKLGEEAVPIGALELVTR